MVNIVALVPARSGSKGVPNKNVRVLGEHPLLAWTIMACKKASTINRVIISTDSTEYAGLAKIYGAEVPFLRPAKISGDRSTDYEFIVHALNWLKEHGEEPDYIVHMRPTTPFRIPEVIDKAVNDFMQTEEISALRSVHEMSESAYKTFEIVGTGQLKCVGIENTEIDFANNARQIFPRTYMANGYVDVLSTAFIRKTGLLHGANVMPFITPIVTEVDTEDDFMNLEYQLTKNSESVLNIFDRDN